MARITVEDCLENVGSRFALTQLATKRVRQLKNGSKQLVNCDNEKIVTALREIAAGKIRSNEEKVTHEDHIDNIISDTESE